MGFSFFFWLLTTWLERAVHTTWRSNGLIGFWVVHLVSSNDSYCNILICMVLEPRSRDG